MVAPLAPPAEIAAVEAAAHGVVPVPTATPTPSPVASPLPPVTAGTPGFTGPSVAALNEAQRLKAPALIVDLSVAPPAPATEPGKAGATDAAKAADGKSGGASHLAALTLSTPAHADNSHACHDESRRHPNSSSPSPDPSPGKSTRPHVIR